MSRTNCTIGLMNRAIVALDDKFFAQRERIGFFFLEYVDVLIAAGSHFPGEGQVVGALGRGTDDGVADVPLVQHGHGLGVADVFEVRVVDNPFGVHLFVKVAFFFLVESLAVLLSAPVVVVRVFGGLPFLGLVPQVAGPRDQVDAKFLRVEIADPRVYYHAGFDSVLWVADLVVGQVAQRYEALAAVLEHCAHSDRRPRTLVRVEMGPHFADFVEVVLLTEGAFPHARVVVLDRVGRVYLFFSNLVV
ncbi:hypothetical protein BpHYR1_009711 [Brachionus plicatilis]|uniref:Uncharacterized protein n=1 Tax=Brachionus plicatilis TaxID=10195 RepID=A0A3M7QD50_BRAPC|nr:hypothetical protein BpHYR1_009711 [Brachionus plicatilis]